MSKGRLTLKEQERRLKLLLEFVFIFRYASRKQLFRLSQEMIGLSDPRRLVDYAVKKGLLKAYRDYALHIKIYHLSQKGKGLIREQEALIERYSFDKRYTGLNTFKHQDAIIESFFLLSRHLDIRDIRNWESEWLLRIGRKKREKLPDALLPALYGIKIALEVETSYKDFSTWKWVASRYRYDIEKCSKYHGVLIVALNKNCLEGIIDKLLKTYPEFCANTFIFADLAMLEKGLCVYEGKARGLKEAAGLLKEKST